jgi:Flp pilus assembly protein TadD
MSRGVNVRAWDCCFRFQTVSRGSSLPNAMQTRRACSGTEPAPDSRMIARIGLTRISFHPRCTILFLMVWTGWSQPPPTTPDQILSQLQTAMRGTREIFTSDPDDVWPSTSQPARPPRESVSIARLEHHISKQAKKAFLRAAKLSRSGEHLGASAQLETAIRRDPNFAAAYDHLGVEYAQLKRFSEAQACLKRAVELDSGSWESLYNLGLVLFQSGDLSGAERNARRAVELSSQNAMAHFFLGYLLYGREDTRDDAIQHLQYVARSIPAAKHFLQSREPR